MKKRMIILLAVCCMWLSGLPAICAMADETTTTLAMDYEMSQFMNRYDVYSATSLDHEMTLISAQTVGGNTVLEVVGAAVNNRGMYATAYAKLKGKNHLFLFYDIRFDADVSFSENEMLKIKCPDGLQDGWGRSVRLYTRANGGEGWVERTYLAVSESSEGEYVEIAVDDLAKTQFERRILLCINGSANMDEVHSPIKLSVIWHRNLGSSSIVIPLLIALIVVIDVIVIILVIRHLKKRKKRKLTSQEMERGDEMTGKSHSKENDELKISLDLKNEDMEYLKSIGYFEPKKFEK